MSETILKSEDGVGYTDFRTIWIVHHDVVVFQSVARMRELSKRGTEWKNKTESDGDRIHKNNNNHKTILIIRSIPSCLVWSQSMSSKSTTNISEKCPTTASIPEKQQKKDIGNGYGITLAKTKVICMRLSQQKAVWGGEDKNTALTQEVAFSCSHRLLG